MLSGNSSPAASSTRLCAGSTWTNPHPLRAPALPPGYTIEGHVIWLSLFIVTLWRLDLWDGELFPFWNLWYEQIKQTFSDMAHRQQHGINTLGGRKGKFRRKKCLAGLQAHWEGDYGIPAFRRPLRPQRLLCIQRRAVGTLLNLAEPQLSPLQNEAQIPPHTPNIVVHVTHNTLKAQMVSGCCGSYYGF